MKKFSLILLTFVLIMASFGGCNLLQPREQNNNSEAAITVGSTIVTTGELRYFVESIKNQMTANLDEAQLKEFWETEKDGQKPEDFILDQALEIATRLATSTEIAVSNGINISTEEVNADISKNMPQDQLNKIAESAQTNVDSIKAIYKKQMIGQKYNESLEGDPRMNPPESELQSFFSEKFLKAQHILKLTLAEDQQTPLPDDQKAAKKKELEDILLKARTAGQDFQALMLETSEDPGSQQQPNGYVFTEGDMVPEFYDATLNLKENDISEIVETSYGYHIIKRLPLDLNIDFQENSVNITEAYKTVEREKIYEEQKDNFEVKKNEDAIKTITVK